MTLQGHTLNKPIMPLKLFILEHKFMIKTLFFNKR